MSRKVFMSRTGRPGDDNYIGPNAVLVALLNFLVINCGQRVWVSLKEDGVRSFGANRAGEYAVPFLAPEFLSKTTVRVFGGAGFGGQRCQPPEDGNPHPLREQRSTGCRHQLNQ